jgi:hypothetical protein
MLSIAYEINTEAHLFKCAFTRHGGGGPTAFRPGPTPDYADGT